MNNKKYQIFVSSTYKDLVDERQCVVQSILELHHIPAGMELFNGGKSQWETITKWINSSDIYLLILGGRYGTLDPEKGLSYTELEYRYAMERKIPAFTIVLEDEYIERKRREYVDKKLREEDIVEKENIDKYIEFKKLVLNNTVVKYVKNIDSITGKVAIEISDKEKNNNLIGWSRGSQENTKLLERIEKLREEKEHLEKNIGNKKEEVLDFNNLKEKLNKELYNILYHEYYNEYEGRDIVEPRAVFSNIFKIEEIRQILLSLDQLIFENIWHPTINLKTFWNGAIFKEINNDSIEMSSIEELNKIYKIVKENYDEYYTTALEKYIKERVDEI